MAEYRLTSPQEPCVVIREDDGACIPPDEANRDYEEYLKWVEDGGVPDPYVEPPPPEPPGPSVEDEVLFDHENRIRAIEGQPPLDLDEFVKQLSG